MSEPESVSAPGTGDMDPEEFRVHAHAAADAIARYLAEPSRWAVLPQLAPGDVAARLPSAAPESGESMESILADVERLILPHTTHWNHPGFFGYFSVTGSGPGILGELWSAALNVNAMLWRSGPAQTELEDVTLGWLRDLLGLPSDFDGTITDTASSSTLYALAAARERLGVDVRARGLAGRDLPALRLYRSLEAHSSVDKAAITLGIGHDNVVPIPTDAGFRMLPEMLERAVEQDRARGLLPFAVVATVGTTGVTAVDPVAGIADVCARHDLWLHVDAAYGGAAAVVPELRWVLEGCERADSLVVNPHKWLFVPIDCSALYTRHPACLRGAFSLTPEYLKTAEGETTKNLMDYGVSLGRRFRALKLWFVLRYFGARGLADRIREHVRLARLFADRVDESADFERLAPVPLSVVVFRWRPGAGAGPMDEVGIDRRNAELLARVNASGEVFLSHTRVGGRYAIRLAVGNIRTTEAHVLRAWELLNEHAGAGG